MFRLTLPIIAHKSVNKSPLPIGLGDEISLELDKSTLDEILSTDNKINNV